MAELAPNVQEFLRFWRIVLSIPDKSDGLEVQMLKIFSPAAIFSRTGTFDAPAWKWQVRNKPKKWWWRSWLTWINGRCDEVVEKRSPAWRKITNLFWEIDFPTTGMRFLGSPTISFIFGSRENPTKKNRTNGPSMCRDQETAILRGFRVLDLETGKGFVLISGRVNETWCLCTLKDHLSSIFVF